MNETSAPTASAAAAVFDLIASFGEAADARLRGNATYAYAALARESDPQVRRRALEELVRVISADPTGLGGADWERRFASRALDAIRQLPETDRHWIGSELLVASAGSPGQRRAVAQFLLEANEPPDRLCPLSWTQVVRLNWRAGRPAVWPTLWAVSWRSSLVWTVIAWATIDYVDSSGTTFLAGVLGAAAMAPLALLSIAGRFRPPRTAWLVDTAVCAGISALLAVLATWLLPDESTRHAASSLVIAGAMGLLLGGAFRAHRWYSATHAHQTSGWARLLRPVAMFCLATLGFTAAAYAGADGHAMGAGWSAFAPAAFLTGWLDIWLESHGPQPLRLARTDTRNGAWTLAATAAALVLATAQIVRYNVNGNLGLNIDVLEQLDAIKAPAAREDKAERTVEVRHGLRVPLSVGERARYRVTADMPPGSPADTLSLFGNGGRLIADGTSTETSPASIEHELDRGVYQVCLSPATTDLCSRTLEFDDLPARGAAVVSRPTAAADMPRRDRRLLIRVAPAD
jgi:hypothetical protein